MKEQISALMDGDLALEDAEYLMTAIKANGEATQAWSTYHLMGDVMRGDAVLLDAHPVIVQPADDGAAGIGAEVSAGDPGQPAQGLAQGALPALDEVTAPQGAGRHRGLLAPQRVAGDDDFSGRGLGHGRAQGARPCQGRQFEKGMHGLDLKKQELA